MTFDTSVSAGPLPATIAAAAATATVWDVIVVGAGPAGAATATQLGRAGLRVLLVDREQFPRPKVCGCCLSPLALDELERLAPVVGGGRLLLASVELIAGGRAARLPLPAGGVQSRQSLDPAIIRAAIAAGAAWLPATRVTAAEPQQTGVSLVAVTSGSSRQRLVTDRLVLAGGLAEAVRVGSDGSSRPAARSRPPQNLIGLGATLPGDSSSLPAGRLAMAVGRRGYCGLVRLEDGRIDVAAAVAPTAVASANSPAAAVAGLLADAGGKTAIIDLDAVAAARFQATPPLTHQTAPVDPASERIYRVGDATGYVEPFTGEGMGWALHAARLLAASLSDPAGGLRPPAAAAACYRRRHQAAFGPRHRRCRGVAVALRSPLLVAAAVRAAAWFPQLAGRVAGLCTGNRGRCFPLPAATPRLPCRKPT